MFEDKPKAANSKPAQKRREKKPPKKITENYLHNAGLYYLERFAASKSHFKTVMGRKVWKSCNHHKDQNYETCMKLVEALADKFEESGLLDDSAYLRGMVTSFRRRGLSRRAIVAKLKAKGLDANQITAAIDTYDEEECDDVEQAEFLAALKQARKKRLGPFDTMNRREPDKAMAALARGGFSFDIVQKVITMNLEEAEEALHKLPS